MKPIEEPVRWLDARSDAPEDVRRLLDRGRGSFDPTAEDVARLSASVAMAASGGAAAAALVKGAAAHGGHALTTGAVKLVVAIAVVGAGGGIGWAVLRSPETPAAPSFHASSSAAPAAASVPPPPVPDEAPLAPAATTAAAASSENEARPPASVAGALPRASSGAVATATATAAAAETPPPAPVPTELALLDRARTRMASDPGDALRALDEHRARYPQGTFVQEREVLAIEALVRLGRRPEAESRAAAFTSEFPGSAHRRRIAVLLGTPAK